MSRFNPKRSSFGVFLVLASLLLILAVLPGIKAMRNAALSALVPQASSCLIQNGDFSSGISIVGGNNSMPPSSVANWSSAFQTPQIGMDGGCGGPTPGYILMWGNKAVGEGIKQTGLSIQAGHVYKLSACVRHRVQPSNPTLPAYVRFNVRASASSGGPVVYAATPPVGSQIGVIGDASNSPVTTPNQGIVSTTWTNVTLANWTANAPYDTITINPENDSTVNNGAYVSWGDIDNICLTEVLPDFQATKACAGQPTQFNANSPGATSWSWNFGSGGANSNQQNPSYTYPTAGTYNVTLCVNGSTACVTKTVTVTSSPPPPVITGPASYCGNLTANYSVPAVSGASYAWTVTNGTINGSATGNSVSVTWNSTGTGTITVTVSSKGKCPATATIKVGGCEVYMGECCHGVEFKTDLQSLTYTNGVYTFTPTLTVSGMSNIVRVTANIISSNVTYSSANCGTAGPINSYVVGASNVGNLIASIPVTNGDEVIWHGGPMSSISNLAFPIQIKFPPPPTNPHCQDYLTFCVKYTFTDSKCHTCEVIRCYGPYKRGGLIEVNSENNPTDKVIQIAP